MILSATPSPALSLSVDPVAVSVRASLRPSSTQPADRGEVPSVSGLPLDLAALYPNLFAQRTPRRNLVGGALELVAELGRAFVDHDSVANPR